MIRKFLKSDAAFEILIASCGIIYMGLHWDSYTGPMPMTFEWQDFQDMFFAALACLGTVAVIDRIKDWLTI